MKKKIPLIYKIIALVAFIVLLALLMMVPPVAKFVSEKTGWVQGKIISVAATVAGIGMGVMMVLFGIAAIGAAPVIGIVVGLAGLGMIAWNLYGMFSDSSSPSTVNQNG